MPTRSGRIFSAEELSAPMNPSLKDILNTLIARMDQMDQRLEEFRDQANANYRDLATWLERLEVNRRRTTEENESRNNSRSPKRERAQPNNTEDTNAQYIKSVKVDAPSFDGRLDPLAYIDWQLVMDHYFCCMTCPSLEKFNFPWWN